MQDKALKFVAAVSTVAFLFLLYRVLAFNAQNGCNVLTGRTASSCLAAPTNAVTNAVATAAQPANAAAPTNEPPCVLEMSFREPDRSGDMQKLRLKLNQAPKAAEILRAMTFEPSVRDVSVQVECRSDCQWDSEQSRFVQVPYWQVSFLSTNFQFRTDYVVTAKGSFPFEDGSTLGRDFRRTLRLDDREDLVRFADDGRYLPPAGDRAVALQLCNVTNLDCFVSAVVPENIVQLLAREECKYDKGRYRCLSAHADSRATLDLARPTFDWRERVDLPPNVCGNHALRLNAEHGVASNGVYLVYARSSKYKEDPGWWDREGQRAYAYRLVCLTDLALSVRADDYGVRLWVTSLTTGRPQGGLDARLYASNRALLARGETDAHGEVVFSGWDTREQPFAVVVTKKDGSDTAFMALSPNYRLDESLPSGGRPAYLAEEETTAFVWSDRGIYRPGETILAHAILRNGKGVAPKPFPVLVSLLDPDGRVVHCRSCVPDERGAVSVPDFVADADRLTGRWKIVVRTPGEKGVTLGTRGVKIEDFVPPQVRVAVKDLPEALRTATNAVAWRVAAENLYGGPAAGLVSLSRYTFADAPFAPAAWKGFAFGDDDRGIPPNYSELDRRRTDARGESAFSVSLDVTNGLPKAAVRLVVQGAVLEPNGRPAYSRGSCVFHYYPYYLGSDVPRQIRQAPGTRTFRVVQVNPDGTAHREARTLKVALYKIDYVHDLVRRENGYQWESTRVAERVPCAETVAADAATGEARLALPTSGSGDYEVVVTDEARNLSHRAAFWISADGDDESHASLENPTRVTIVPDKNVYREGERPRLTVKAPFRGAAWLAVMRDRTLYTRTLELTNLTSVVELDPLDAAWAPNVDVAVSVVQSVKAGRPLMATRARGVVALRVRPRVSDIAVTLAADVRTKPRGGSAVDVRVAAAGAANADARAVVTVVDEGINILTNEPVPDPVGAFSILRAGEHPLYDVFMKLLPVYDETFRVTGVKTGGGGLAELMNRMSPVPTRRFRPLSQWRLDVPLTNGAATVRFDLPEFVGEVRVTSVVYTKAGTGAAAIRQKVCPKVVAQCDAPRFVAPGDRFDLTLTLANRSGAANEASYRVAADGGAVKVLDKAEGSVRLADGETKVLRFAAEATGALGEAAVRFRASGCGETHEQEILLPVRPAVAWEERADVLVLKPGEARALAAPADDATMQRAFRVSGSPQAELVAAMDYLADYPHGCLEQTVSRLFPLLTGDVFLDRLSTNATSKAADAKDILAAGVARVSSMVRQNDFTMWPDVDCAPWDREVSVYAAQFLVEASRAKRPVESSALSRVEKFLKKWVFDANTNAAALACQTLAVMGKPNKDRMFALYDARASLPLLARARLARGFVRIGEPKRARALVADAALAPRSVEEASAALLAILEMDAHDARIGRLVLYLQQARDKSRFHWGTTGANAAALHALGAYYRVAGLGEGKPEVTLARGGEAFSLGDGETRKLSGGGAVELKNTGKDVAFVSVRQLALPAAASVTNAHGLICATRRFLTPDGKPADLKNVRRGDVLVGEITLSADREAEFTDLVVQDLFPAGLEPDCEELAAAVARAQSATRTAWELRRDVRDDRLVAFSRPVTLRPEGSEAKPARLFYAVRAVSAGEFVLPGVRVEAMYAPEVFAQTAPARLVVKP